MRDDDWQFRLTLLQKLNWNDVKWWGLQWHFWISRSTFRGWTGTKLEISDGDDGGGQDVVGVAADFNCASAADFADATLSAK